MLYFVIFWLSDSWMSEASAGRRPQKRKTPKLMGFVHIPEEQGLVGSQLSLASLLDTGVSVLPCWSIICWLLSSPWMSTYVHNRPPAQPALLPLSWHASVQSCSGTPGLITTNLRINRTAWKLNVNCFDPLALPHKWQREGETFGAGTGTLQKQQVSYQRTRRRDHKSSVSLTELHMEIFTRLCRWFMSPLAARSHPARHCPQVPRHA